MHAMKKVLAVLLLCGCGCLYYGGQACASPLKNYGPGHVAVSVGGTIPTNMHFTEYDTDSKKASVYGGVTAGIGSNTALNYKYDTYKTSSDDITTNQLNLMYQFIPGLSVYGGYVHAKTDVGNSTRAVIPARSACRAASTSPCSSLSGDPPDTATSSTLLKSA